MIDLHTHILHGIDDGAQTLNEAIELLRAEQNQGVTTVALTPHFHCERIDYQNFLLIRENAFKALKEQLKKEKLSIQILIGAEVFLNPLLLSYDLSQFAIKGTDYILIEFPVEFQPVNLRNLLYHIRLKGFIPIIAHIERYSYLRKQPELLMQLVEDGNFCQINASSINNMYFKRFIGTCIKKELLHIIASDIHSLSKSPPHLSDAFKKVEKMGRKDLRNLLMSNANKIIQNKPIY